MTKPKAGKGWRMLPRENDQTIAPILKGDHWYSESCKMWVKEEFINIPDHRMFYRRRIASKPKMGRTVTVFLNIYEGLKERPEWETAFGFKTQQYADADHKAGLCGARLGNRAHKLVIPIKEKE